MIQSVTIADAPTAMRAVLATAGIVLIGALTPGPNNLIVLERAAQRGFASALPVIAAITSGSVALILVAGGGAAMLLDRRPWLAGAVTIAGCTYLCWLGLRLLIGASGQVTKSRRVWSDRIWALFAFQFANPKGWAIALTASTALEGSRSLSTALLDLVTLFAMIPALCLLLWSAVGAVLSRFLRRADVRLVFDRAMGLLLLVFALVLAYGE